MYFLYKYITGGIRELSCANKYPKFKGFFFRLEMCLDVYKQIYLSFMRSNYS